MTNPTPTSSQPPDPPGPPLRTGQIVFFVTVIVLGCGLWYGTEAMLRSAAAARIPEMPALPGAATPVVEQIQQADARARAHPESGALIGALGKTYHANGYSAAARPVYELARALDPGNRRWPYYLVLLDEEIGDTEAALAGLRQIVRSSADYAPAWYRLGEAAFSSGLDDRADQAFARMAELDGRSIPGADREPFFPVSAYAAFGRARVAYRRGQSERVVELLAPVVEASVMFGAGHRLLGRALMQLGRDDEGQRHLDQALRCGPYSSPVDPLVDELTLLSTSSTFLTREAGVAFNKGDVAWAERVLRRAFQLDPDDEDVLGELTLLLVRMGELDEARPLLDRFLSFPPTHHATPGKIGSELSLQNRNPEATRCFQAAVDIQPAHPPNQLNLGMALARSGRVAEAEPYFRETLRLDPTSYLAHRNLATALFDLKRYDEAIDEYHAAIDLRPEDPDPRYRLGLVLQLTQRLDEAEAAFRGALVQDPDHMLSLDNLARLLSAFGEHAEAMEMARHLVTVGDRFAQAHYALAYVLRNAGDDAGARQACEASLRIDPDFAPAHQLMAQLEP